MRILIYMYLTTLLNRVKISDKISLSRLNRNLQFKGKCKNRTDSSSLSEERISISVKKEQKPRRTKATAELNEFIVGILQLMKFSSHVQIFQFIYLP